MNKVIIEKFLKNNPLDSMYNLSISLGTLIISSEMPTINFSMDIEFITSIGLNCRNIFFDTKFGRFEFLKADSWKLFRRDKNNI